MSCRSWWSGVAIRMPLVASSATVDLSISHDKVEIEVPQVYAALAVALPEGLDDAKAIASFDRKARELKVQLPRR